MQSEFGRKLFVRVPRLYLFLAVDTSAANVSNVGLTRTRFPTLLSEADFLLCSDTLATLDTDFRQPPGALARSAEDGTIARPNSPV